MSKALYRKKVNLGYKEKVIKNVRGASRKTYYPSFYISSVRLPLKPSDIGNSFVCEVVVDLTGVREETDRSGNSYNYDFEMKSIKFK